VIPLHEEELLTIAELAALSKESRRTIERRIASGVIPVVHLSSRAVRITHEAATLYLRRGNADMDGSLSAPNIHPINGGTA
jgi:hypothetical protein